MRLHLLLILLFAGSFVAGARIRRQTSQSTSSDETTELVTENPNTKNDDLSIMNSSNMFINLIKNVIYFCQHMVQLYKKVFGMFLTVTTLPQKLSLYVAFLPFQMILRLLGILWHFVPIP